MGLLTFRQALLIAKHPQYYHSDNLREAIELIKVKDLYARIQEELDHRATMQRLKAVVPESLGLLPSSPSASLETAVCAGNTD